MAEEQQWARGYDGFTFRDPGTQLGSSGAQAAHGVTLHAHTEGWHLPGVQGQSTWQTSCHKETFTPRVVTQQKLKDYKPPRPHLCPLVLPPPTKQPGGETGQQGALWHRKE